MKVGPALPVKTGVQDLLLMNGGKRLDGWIDGRMNGRTDVYLLGTYIVNFQLTVPNNHHKYPTSPSNLLGICFGHQWNK